MNAKVKAISAAAKTAADRPLNPFEVVAAARQDALDEARMKSAAAARKLAMNADRNPLSPANFIREPAEKSRYPNRTMGSSSRVDLAPKRFHMYSLA